MSEVRKLIESLHARNFGEAGSLEMVRDILDSYGFDDTRCPEWFRRLLEMVNLHKAGEYVFPDEPSDVGSVLLELQQNCGWRSDNYGEGIELDFPADGMQAAISFEARDGSCTIKRLHPG